MLLWLRNNRERCYNSAFYSLVSFWVLIMAIYKTIDIVICDLCAQYIANGDISPVDYHYSGVEAEEKANAIQQGEERITEGHGRIHVDSDSLTEYRSYGCDCCGDYSAGSRYIASCYTAPLDKDGSLDHRFIIDVKVTDQPRTYSVTGYGRKIPTRYMLLCADNKKRRVYVITYANSGSPYVIIGGDMVFLSVDSECKIKELVGE